MLPRPPATYSIMQPYLFPYIGYFQLINASEVFFVGDNVQYIRQGWINRNRLLAPGTDPPFRYFILPVRNDHFEKKICERIFNHDFAEQKRKILRQIGMTYRRAPCFAPVMEMLERAFALDDPHVSRFITHCLRLCCHYLGIQTPIFVLSDFEMEDNMERQERVINIGYMIQSAHYINMIGGMELYKKDTFREQGIKLSYLKPREITYQQFKQEHVPWLSIIDVMMFNPVDRIRQFLGGYDLL